MHCERNGQSWQTNRSCSNRGSLNVSAVASVEVNRRSPAHGASGTHQVPLIRCSPVNGGYAVGGSGSRRTRSLEPLPYGGSWMP